MRLKLFSAAALALALAGFGPRVAEAEIIWSGVQIPVWVCVQFPGTSLRPAGAPAGPL